MRAERPQVSIAATAQCGHQCSHAWAKHACQLGPLEPGRCFVYLRSHDRTVHICSKSKPRRCLGEGAWKWWRMSTGLLTPTDIESRPCEVTP